MQARHSLEEISVSRTIPHSAHVRVHANPCLAPQDFNNPSARANLRLTRRASRSHLTYLRVSVAHELAMAVMPGSTAQRGEGSIHTATHGLGVGVALRNVPSQRLFDIRAPKSEEPISLRNPL
jgi:hypothetical protein